MTQHPATGRQFVLTRGAARAQVGQVAAVLREYSVGGVAYTETWPDTETPPMGCGLVLMPWPNRVAGGRWSHDGVDHQLDLSEPGRGNAIHGLLRFTAYQPTDVTESSVTLSAPIYPQHGWPFMLDTSVRYELTDDGLRVTHAVRNIGRDDCVFGCGAHPYLRVGAVPVEEATLTVRAGSRIETGEAMIPVRTEPLSGELTALRTGVKVGDVDLDTGFADIELADSGRVEHRLTSPDGSGIVLWADPVFAWVQVFTPDDFPGTDGPRRAVAIEPMTCPADALNSGLGLIRLAPGQTWTGSWGLSPFSR